VAKVKSREPETLVFVMHGVTSAPMQRILYEVYRDQAAYEHHAEQGYIQEFEEQRKPFVLATNVIELGVRQAKVLPLMPGAAAYPVPEPASPGRPAPPRPAPAPSARPRAEEAAQPPRSRARADSVPSRSRADAQPSRSRGEAPPSWSQGEAQPSRSRGDAQPPAARRSDGSARTDGDFWTRGPAEPGPPGEGDFWDRAPAGPEEPDDGDFWNQGGRGNRYP